VLDDVGPAVGAHRRGAAVGSFGAPTPEALLRAVSDAATDLASVRDRGVILQALVRRTRALLGADMAYLSLNDLDAGETWIHVTDGVRTAAYAGIRMPLGTGILGAVAAGGTSVHTDDYLADRDLNHLTHIDAVVAGEGVRAISGEPLRVDGHLVGALLVAHRAPVAMPPAGLAALRLMALQAAVALEQTRRAGEIAELRALTRSARDDAARHGQAAADAAALLALDARLIAAVEIGSGCHAVLEELSADLAAPVALLDARGEVRSGSPAAQPDDGQSSGSECAVDGDRGCVVSPARGARADAVLARGALAVGLALQVEHELAEAADRSASTLLDDLLGDHLDDGPDGDRAARREVAEARALSHGVDLRAPTSSLVVLVPAAERQRGVAALRPLVARGGLVSVHAGHVCLLCARPAMRPPTRLATARRRRWRRRACPASWAARPPPAAAPARCSARTPRRRRPPAPRRSSAGAGATPTGPASVSPGCCSAVTTSRSSTRSSSSSSAPPWRTTPRTAPGSWRRRPPSSRRARGRARRRGSSSTSTRCGSARNASPSSSGRGGTCRRGASTCTPRCGCSYCGRREDRGRRGSPRATPRLPPSHAGDRMQQRGLLSTQAVRTYEPALGHAGLRRPTARFLLSCAPTCTVEGSAIPARHSDPVCTTDGRERMPPSNAKVRRVRRRVKPAGVVYLVVRVMLVVGQAVRACRGSVVTS